MAGASFKMDMSGLKRMTGKAIRHLSDTRGLMETIGEQLVSSTLERFEDETAPDGTQWKKSQRAESEGGQTLSDTGILKGSVHYEASPAMVAVGSNDERYAIHQFGGEITPKKAKKLAFNIGGKKVFTDKVTMPVRSSIGINDEDKQEARDMIRLFMMKGFGIK